MAVIIPSAELKVEFTLKLNETEARYLAGLAGYAHEAIKEALDALDALGKSYTRDYGSGLLSFLASVQENVPPGLRRIDAARKVFNGELEVKEKA